MGRYRVEFGEKSVEALRELEVADVLEVLAGLTELEEVLGREVLGENGKVGRETHGASE